MWFSTTIRREEAFAKIDLVILLLIAALIGVIAHGRYSSLRFKAMASETYANLNAIAVCQRAYFTAMDTYVGNQGYTPVANRQHDSRETPWNFNTRFSIIGFAPLGVYPYTSLPKKDFEGLISAAGGEEKITVVFSYGMDGPDWPTKEEGFTSTAVGDFDLDGRLSTYTLTSFTKVTEQQQRAWRKARREAF
jgi:type II secretory pathway pseudopilin PulG